MNFLNKMVSAMGDRLNAKFNPSSPTFAQGGALAGMGHPTEEYAEASIGPVGMGAAATPGQNVAQATPEKERAARSMGFRNFDEMIAFERNRSARSGNNQTTGQAGQIIRQAPANAMAAHPKSIFQYITDAMAGNPNK